MASTTIFCASPVAKAASPRQILSLPSTNPNPSFASFPQSRNGSLRSTRQRLSIRAALQVERQDSVKQPSSPPPALPYRIGHGFDLHRLEPGLPLIIGGVNIPHDRGCEAHSDGNRSYNWEVNSEFNLEFSLVLFCWLQVMCCFTVWWMRYWGHWGSLT